eukprot:12690423-Alexandrium_andersonii.AAC.1
MSLRHAKCGNGHMTPVKIVLPHPTGGRAKRASNGCSPPAKAGRAKALKQQPTRREWRSHRAQTGGDIRGMRGDRVAASRRD